MIKRKSPVTIQQWVDALPSASQPARTTPPVAICTPVKFNRVMLARDVSIQSDDASSLCSSVESVLESRKPDPEAVLLGLGFGPPELGNYASRIPQRFLQPSKVLRNLDISKFLEKQDESQLPDQNFNSTPSSPARRST